MGVLENGRIDTRLFQSTYRNAADTLDRRVIESLDPEYLKSIDALCEVDRDGQFLRDFAVDLQLLVRGDHGQEFSGSIYDLSGVNSSPTSSSSTLEQRLREVVEQIRHSRLATLQIFRQATAGLHSRKGEASLNYVLTSHIINDPDEYEEMGADSLQSEVVLNVRITTASRPVKSQELLVLGSSRLTELRDSIYCLSDRIAEREASWSGQDPAESEQKMHEIMGPSFLFIEDCFYSDTRNSSSAAYSDRVIRWIEEKRSKRGSRYNPGETAQTLVYGGFEVRPTVGQIQSRSMEDVRFDELVVALGQPYVYMHCSTCEHIVQFLRIRFLHRHDEMNRKAYPLTVYHTRIRRKRCRCCDIYSASYVTFGDKFAPENPCFYCERCYLDFHYDASGSLVYSDYQVYNYIHE